VAPLPAAGGGGGTSEAAVPQGVAVLKNVNSNKFLSSAWLGTTLGSNVQIWDTAQAYQSHWDIQPVAGGVGVYTLKNVNSGLYVSVMLGGTSQGANVNLNNNPDSNATRWEIRSVGGRVCTLKNVNSGMYLTVAGGGTANGANVVIGDTPDSTDSQWKITMQEAALRWRNVIGSGGSSSDATTYDKAWDGDANTYYNAANASGSYTAVQLLLPSEITSINFQPRSGHSSRMVGGRFEAAVSETGPWDLLYTIATAPREGQLTPVVVHSTTYYQWVRYAGPSGSYSNVAQISLRGVVQQATTPMPTVAGDNQTSPVILEGAAAGGAAAAGGGIGGPTLSWPTLSAPHLSQGQWRITNYALLTVFLITCLSALVLGLLPKKSCSLKRKRQKVKGRLEVFGEAQSPYQQPVALPMQPSYAEVPTTVPIMAPQHTLPPVDPVDRYSQGFIDAVAATAPTRQRPHGLMPSAMWVPLKQNN
jgi:hypothetical protein